MSDTQGDPRRFQRQSPFATVLSDAIQRSGLTLSELSQRLSAAGTPASSATLSYWQNGRAKPVRGRSMQVVVTLEMILGLPQGSLTRFTDQGHPARWLAKEVVQEAASVEQVLGAWGLSLDPHLVSIFLQETVTVADNGRSTKSTVRQVVRATGRVERAMPLVYSDEPTGIAPDIKALYGASVGRIQRDAQQARTIAELVLPRPLRRDEHTWFEYEVAWADTVTPFVGRNERLLPSLTELLTLDVVFEGAVAARVSYWTQPADDSAPTQLPLVPRGKAFQVVVPDAAPGTHCIEWTNAVDDPDLGPSHGPAQTSA